MSRRVAVLFGLVTHATFAAAIVTMVLALHEGLDTGRGTLVGGAAWVANAALLLSFPIVHSLLLSHRGRALLARAWPGPHGADLVTTSYAFLASAQLLLVFLAWSPSGVVWFVPQGALAPLSEALFVGAWIFLGKALADGGLALQTGALGWLAVARGRTPDYGPLRTAGLFARCRQPIYLGFALTLWTGPVWTPDHLLIAGGWTLYCVFGPLLKERRFLRWHGAAFAAYQGRVPYFLPRILP